VQDDDDEFALIARYFRPLQDAAGSAALRLGIGDDGALLALEPGEVLATSVDTVVAAVHYPKDAAAPDIGYRALAVAASDLAAMGARPLGCTLALTLPQADPHWLRGFSRGLGEACGDFQLPLIGGDTTRGQDTVITLQVLGGVPEDLALRRSGARPGDRVCVSGTLGDAAAALALWRGDWSPAVQYHGALAQRFYRPASRLGLGQALRAVASSAIDVSDGLLADLAHLCSASAVAMELDGAALPLSEALQGETRARDWALHGGDDYELAFTLPPGQALPAGCSCIGRVTAGSGLMVDGEPVAARGYRHF